MSAQDTGYPSVEPDLEEAQRFLKLLDPEGVFTFQTFSDMRRTEVQGGKRTSDPNARIFHGTLAQHAGTLTILNTCGIGIFVMVNKGDLKGRRIENVVTVRAYFVDLDGAPIEPVLNAPLPPSIIVESSPMRYHAYWMASDCPRDAFKSRQLTLAAKYGGDRSVVDLPRVMRLPGFFHHKGLPFMTRIMSPSKEQNLE